MSSELAYLLLTLMAVLVVYFGYQSYQDYKKNPTRWALRELVTDGIERWMK
jgi:hypothetical protein